jgi:ABC-2 type transport system permease protein
VKPYITYFKSELIVGLQYKEAALAGLSTQFFWGLLYAFVYQAFYSYANVDSINFRELMCYVWLNQAFYSLILLVARNTQIMDQIKNGTVAYELCRPYSLYWWWFLKNLSKRYSACILRCLPVLVFGFILPKPYNLTFPPSIEAFILFVVSLFLGSLLVISMVMIVQTIGFFTNEDKGVASIFYTVGALLSGIAIPLPLMPTAILNFGEYLPFRLVSDLSQRVYSGNIGIAYGLQSIGLQIIWIIVLIIIGEILMKIALNKISVQGG